DDERAHALRGADRGEIAGDRGLAHTALLVEHDVTHEGTGSGVARRFRRAARAAPARSSRARRAPDYIRRGAAPRASARDRPDASTAPGLIDSALGRRAASRANANVRELALDALLAHLGEVVVGLALVEAEQGLEHFEPREGDGQRREDRPPRP